MSPRYARVLQRLDGDVLDRAVVPVAGGRQQAAAAAVAGGLRPIALDGKTCRGARSFCSALV